MHIGKIFPPIHIKIFRSYINVYYLQFTSAVQMYNKNINQQKNSIYLFFHLGVQISHRYCNYPNKKKLIQICVLRIFKRTT